MGVTTVTDAKTKAVIDSLAAELSRVAHTWPAPEDDDDEFFESSLNLAHIIRLAPVLCGPHIAALAKLVTALYEIKDHEPADERTHN
jgi:hypothetical protein